MVNATDRSLAFLGMASSMADWAFKAEERLISVEENHVGVTGPAATISPRSWFQICEPTMPGIRSGALMRWNVPDTGRERLRSRRLRQAWHRFN